MPEKEPQQPEQVVQRSEIQEAPAPFGGGGQLLLAVPEEGQEEAALARMADPVSGRERRRGAEDEDVLRVR